MHRKVINSLLEKQWLFFEAPNTARNYFFEVQLLFNCISRAIHFNVEYNVKKQPFADVLQNRYCEKLSQYSLENTYVGVSF